MTHYVNNSKVTNHGLAAGQSDGFNDRIEIKCEIPLETEIFVNVIPNLILPPLTKRLRRHYPSKL
jgi:hypothetical protein